MNSILTRAYIFLSVYLSEKFASLQSLKFVKSKDLQIDPTTTEYLASELCFTSPVLLLLKFFLSRNCMHF